MVESTTDRRLFDIMDSFFRGLLMSINLIINAPEAFTTIFGSLEPLFLAIKPAFAAIALAALALVLFKLLLPPEKNKRNRGNRRGYQQFPAEDSRAPEDLGDGSPIGNFTYYSKPVMSAAEYSFFVKLYEVAKLNYWVFTKVSLWEIARNNEQAGWTKISQKHVDFVLCDPRDARVVLAIELDDSTHNRASAQKRDAQKDAVLASAGVPFLRVRTGNNDAAIEAVRNKLVELSRRGD